MQNRARHEAACAAMRARLRPSPERQHEKTLAKQRAARHRERTRKENNGFARMKTYLERQERELAEERYVTAMWGVRTSWAAIEEAGRYVVVEKVKGRKVSPFDQDWGFRARPLALHPARAREDQPRQHLPLAA